MSRGRPTTLLAASLSLLILAVAALSAMAADTWPNCSFNCTAGDVTLASVYIVASGSACEPGGTSTAQVYGRFTASARRYAIILMGDLYVEGGVTRRLTECAGDLAAGTSDVLLTTIAWPCGSSVTLGNVTVSWSASPETCASATCSSRKAKCSTSEDLVVSTPLVADFASDSPQCLGTPISFTNVSTGGTAPHTYSWTFGDGGTSSQESPSHTYAAPGTYNVTLTVRDRSGSSDSRSHSVTVSPTPAATAANSGPYCPGATISLVASGGASYSWTGPNGFSSSLQSPTIPSASAAKAGVYTVVVTSAAGCTAEADTIVEVDSTSPFVTAPPDVTVGCGDPTGPAATGEATATDDSGSHVSVSYSDAARLTGCGVTGTITRTWTASDACGNTTSVFQTVTVADVEAPVLTVPEDVAVECGDPTTPEVTGQATAADDCATPVVTFSDRVSPSSCGGTGSITRTWTAMDVCGNRATGIQTITVTDSEAPALNLPADVTVECGHSTAPSATGWATATDGCSTPAVTYADAASLTECGGSGTIVRTWTAADACGHTAAGTQTITVADRTPPRLVSPQNVVVECGHSTAPAATGQATATDNCSAPVVTYADDTSLAGCNGTGTIVRTWTAVDACGHQATDIQTITISDLQAPRLDVPADVTVECGHSTEPAATGRATATDGCSTPTIAYEDSAELTGCGGSGTIVRTWTATDACGQTTVGTQTITVADTAPPHLVSPEDVIVQCGHSTAPAATGQATAIDNCSVSIVTYRDEVSLTECGGTGRVVRTWTATDACGHSTTDIQTISVVDTVAPSLTAPGHVTIEAGQSTSPEATGQATATDACAAVAITYFDESSLGSDGTGTVTRTWTAADPCGNAATNAQIITIRTSPPPPTLTLTIPADVTIEAGYSTAPSATGNALVSSTCPTAPSLTYSDAADLTGCDGTGIILRTWAASDECGNSVTGIQTITVIDTGGLLLTAPADTTVESGAATDPSATGWATASDPDAADEPPLVTYSDVADLSGCDETGTILRTWTASDECGNQASAVQTITVVDSGGVSLAVPADITVEVGTPTGPEIAGWASASDPDAGAEPPTITYSDVVDLSGCGGTGVIERTWTATDACGNLATGVQTIAVADTVAPLLTVPVDATIESGTTTDATVGGWATASDPNGADGLLTVTYSDVADLSGCGETGTILRTWTASDECGNRASAVQTITVVDSEGLSLALPADVTVQAGTSMGPEAAGWASASDPDAGDEPPTITYSDVADLSGCDGTGTILRTWTAVDACGTSMSGVQVIAVVDTLAPVLTVPADVTVETVDSVDPSATGWASVGHHESDHAPTLTYDDVSDRTGCDGTGFILRTWTVTDECGNLASATQRITIVDSGHVSLLTPPDAVVACGLSYSPDVTGWATASDPDAIDEAPVVDYSDAVALSCGGSGTVVRTWTATDECGNAVSADQTITLTDITPPALHVPADVLVELGDTTQPVATGRASATDSCSMVQISHADVEAPGSCVGRWVILRTWAASDECGNTASAVQTITVTDTTPPLLVLPSDTVVVCGHSTLPSATGEATASDEGRVVSIAYSDRELDPRCGGARTVQRTWTAIDTCGNVSSAVQTITVIDSVAPDLTTPADILVTAGQSTLPNDVGQASAVDACSIPVVTYSDSVALDANGVGTITRTWMAADACGNSTIGTQVITLASTPPLPQLALTAPGDRTISAGTPADPSATGTAVVVGDCPGGAIVTYADQAALDACTGAGIIVRTWAAADACGNQATAVQTITVVDVSQLELIAPADVVVSCRDAVDPSSTGLASAYDLDGTGAPPIVAHTDAANLDAWTGEGTILRTWTATDSCGRSVSAVQTITVSGSCAPRVVISEIAWAGTGASAEDQWIELRNLGDDPVDLIGWTLRWRPARFELPGDDVWRELDLSGTVGSAAADASLPFGPNPQDPQTWWVDLSGRQARSDFFVLERLSDDTVLGVRAGLIYDDRPAEERTLALPSEGAVLQLVSPTGYVVDTANAEREGVGGWCAGDGATRGSMERTDPYGGDVPQNWHTNLGIITAGNDADGVGLLATAGLENEPRLAQLVAMATLTALPVGGGAGVTVLLPTQVGASGDQTARLVTLSPETSLPVVLPVDASTSGDVVTLQASGTMPSGQSAVWVRIGEVAILVALQGP